MQLIIRYSQRHQCWTYRLNNNDRLVAGGDGLASRSAAVAAAIQKMAELTKHKSAGVTRSEPG